MVLNAALVRVKEAEEPLGDVNGGSNATISTPRLSKTRGCNIFVTRRRDRADHEVAGVPFPLSPRRTTTGAQLAVIKHLTLAISCRL